MDILPNQVHDALESPAAAGEAGSYLVDSQTNCGPGREPPCESQICLHEGMEFSRSEGGAGSASKLV